MALRACIIEDGDELRMFCNLLPTVCDFMKVHENQDDTRSFVAAVFDDNELICYQPFMVQRFIKFLPRKLGSFAVARYEPCVVGKSGYAATELFSMLLESLTGYLKSRSLYLEFRHYGEHNRYHDILINSGFKAVGWSNVIVDIESGADVMKIIDKPKRRQVRSSVNAGALVDNSPSEERVAQFYVLLRRLYRKIRRPLPDLQIFQNMAMSGSAKFFIVVVNGKVLAGTVILLVDNMAFEYYRAAEQDKGSRDIYPSVLAVYSAMQWVADNGGGRFDFMGSGAWNKDSGIRRFKLTFGGQLVREYRYRKILGFF